MKAADVSYEFYFNVYCGTAEPKLSQSEFLLLREKAWSYVVSHMGSNMAEAVKENLFMTVCEAAEAIHAFEKAKGIKSESIDGYSVTYEDGRSLEHELLKIILRRLGSSGALYAGVDRC